MTTTTTTIDRTDISRVHGVIRPYIRRTPVVEIAPADFGLAARSVTFKLELLQHSGSFKARGAFTHLLTRTIPATGIVAASGGNHGAGVAFAAARLKVPCTVFVPTVCSPAKIARLREYGANVRIEGDRYADALAASRTWADQSGALEVHAYDQPETLLGQGTLGLEFSEQAPDLDTILVAVGGGGLIGGVASWYREQTRIVGVEPKLAPTLYRALEAGQPVDAEAGGIAADSLAPRRVGELMFPIAQRFVERVALVSDEAIVEAQRTLWRTLRIMTEPGGAAAFAAWQSGAYTPAADERLGIVLCGGNVTIEGF